MNHVTLSARSLSEEIGAAKSLRLRVRRLGPKEANKNTAGVEGDSEAGLWDQGVYLHFCDIRESSTVYGGLIFGKPLLLYQKWSFPTALLGGKDTPAR